MSQYELVQFVEPAFQSGGTFPGTQERGLGLFDVEAEAIEVGRAAWTAFRQTGSADVVWWIVRVPGEALARWIADGSSPVERVLNLRTNELVEVR